MRPGESIRHQEGETRVKYYRHSRRDGKHWKLSIPWMYVLKLRRRHSSAYNIASIQPGPLYGTVDMILRLYTLSSLLQGLAATSMVFASPGKADQTIFSPPHTPETDNFADLVRPAGNLPTLADLLTLEGRASIFYSYARETDMSARFVRAEGEGEGTTVFVPTNKAVQALARKPYVLSLSLLFTDLCMFLFYFAGTRILKGPR